MKRRMLQGRICSEGIFVEQQQTRHVSVTNSSSVLRSRVCVCDLAAAPNWETEPGSPRFLPASLFVELTRRTNGSSHIKICTALWPRAARSWQT